MRQMPKTAPSLTIVLAGALAYPICACEDDQPSRGRSAGSAGEAGQIATAGEGGQAGTAGEGGHAGTAGEGGQIATAGEGGQPGTAGTGGQAGAAGDAAQTPEEKFELRLSNAMEEEQIPGVAAAIVQGDHIAWSRGYGLADVESERPATPDTPFTLASVSKTFIAVAAMQAIENGILTLDTPINEVGLPFELDNPNVDGESITLRHLATHTSGIVDSAAYDCSYYVEADDSPLIALVDPSIQCAEPMLTELGDYLEAYLAPGGAYYSAEDNFGSNEPGRVYEYSNVGAALAGLALGAATGTPLDELCERGIFEPLGMASTHWHRAQFEESSPVATEYTRIAGEQLRLPEYSLATWPDGGLRSSANDLARFIGAIMNGGRWEGKRILEQNSVDTMLSPQTDLEPGVPGNQGVFWVEEFGLIGHNGGDPGAITYMYMLPGEDVAFVMLMNQDVGMETWASLLTGMTEFAESFAE